MPKKDRTRIDWMPGNAALDALALATEMFPKLRQQALIDRLVITAASALAHHQDRWTPPSLWGSDRDRWKLPDNLKPESPTVLTGEQQV